MWRAVFFTLASSLAAAAEPAALKPKLVSYDWLPGNSMDDMARFVPQADPCWQRLAFDTTFLRALRLRGTFLLSAVHFDAPESLPGQLGSRQSEDVVATTSTGFIREIELVLTERGKSRVVQAASGSAPYQARYLMTVLGANEERLAFELGWSTRTSLTVTRGGKPCRLRAWLDCDPALARCRIKNGQITLEEDPAQGFKFTSPYFPIVVRDTCVRLP